jgi:uncharacterized membrane protein
MSGQFYRAELHAQTINTKMNWHDRYVDSFEFGDHLADKIAAFIGSWKFVIIQSTIFVIWVLINTLYFFDAIRFDPYPFILFNLFMSAEAAYSSPLILMSQNRQAIRDRHQAEVDYMTNVEAKQEIEQLQKDLARIETEKLDHIRDRVLILLEKHEHILEKLDARGRRK